MISEYLFNKSKSLNGQSERSGSSEQQKKTLKKQAIAQRTQVKKINLLVLFLPRCGALLKFSSIKAIGNYFDSWALG